MTYRESDNESLLRQIADIQSMDRAGLEERWQVLFGKPAPAHNTASIRKQLIHRLQEVTYGGLEEAVRQELREMVPPEDRVDGDPATPPRNRRRRKDSLVSGTELRRTWNGQVHVVIVLSDGFEWRGQRYKSLSAIAKKISGVQWNGWRFFGVRSPNDTAKESA